MITLLHNGVPATRTRITFKGGRQVSEQTPIIQKGTLYCLASLWGEAFRYLDNNKEGFYELLLEGGVEWNTQLSNKYYIKQLVECFEDGLVVEVTDKHIKLSMDNKPFDEVINFICLFRYQKIPEAHIHEWSKLLDGMGWTPKQVILASNTLCPERIFILNGKCNHRSHYIGVREYDIHEAINTRLSFADIQKTFNDKDTKFHGNLKRFVEHSGIWKGYSAMFLNKPDVYHQWDKIGDFQQKYVGVSLYESVRDAVMADKPTTPKEFLQSFNKLMVQ